MELPVVLAAKRDRLLTWLHERQPIAVAFSGGVDSAVVAQAARLACGDKALAITADSPSVPRAELAAAQHLARLIGIPHVTLPTHEVEQPAYRRNDGLRCYHCKTELYTRIRQYLQQRHEGVSSWTIVSGANVDDAGDFRPGLQAAAEQHVRHPLQEIGLTKAEVRQLARHWGLPVWDKPASPCLSSRLAPGVAVTQERLARVEAAEAFLRQHGLRDCRVRYHADDLARVEVPIDDLPALLQEPIRSELVNTLLQLGFRYVTLDLQGLRSGSLNTLVPLEIRLRYTNIPVSGGRMKSAIVALPPSTPPG
ncbi:MAG: ATP-dependent sacrificial sulfur transferase LarE [Gemmataceae bacterium]|nr:ATP-dependent sacrificial sulfur transferase LarE [Gemmataceae bacterium]MDW8242385.1 ATP-dependent sacrificial sulfur transferase LarE [Thermogemmata sp.]